MKAHFQWTSKLVHSKNARKRIILFLAVLAVIISFTIYRPQNKAIDTLPNSIQNIIDRDTLRVGTVYSGISYFIYRGEPMGWQYDLAEQCAQHLGVELKIYTAKDIEGLFEMLQHHDIDIIGYYLPIDQSWKDSLIYCGPQSVSHQVLVQRNAGQRQINDVTQLVGEKVYVSEKKYCERIANLQDELGGGIDIVYIPSDSLNAEELITKVAFGKIGYTIADEDVAKYNKTYFPNLRTDLSVSYDQRAQWAVNKGMTVLADTLNSWNHRLEMKPAYEANMKRYFELSKLKATAPVISIQNNVISPYDTYFKEFGTPNGWDWRLLAAIAYTESRFDLTVVSWVGATGIMQLMPTTAHAMGVPEGQEKNSKYSVKGAVNYLNSLERSLKRRVPQASERYKFELAAYNSGLGHILDAIALAQKYGADPTIWDDNVERFILLKSKEKYYTDSVCRFGYFRGAETYQYVRDVESRYKQYIDLGIK